MRCWWAENRESALESSAHLTQSLLKQQCGERRSAKAEEGLWTVVVGRRTKNPKLRKKPRCINADKNSGALFTFENHSCSSEHVWEPVLNHITSALSTSGDESYSSFSESIIYLPVCYSSSHVMSECCRIKKDIEFVRNWNANYNIWFGKRGHRPRQMPYPVSPHSLPPQRNSAKQGKFRNNNHMWHGTQYPPG